MTGKPYRLADSAGRVIDRSKPVTFMFDGRRYRGFAGDTLASALLANGVRLLGRSFKYHRPRGVIGLGAEEANALVGVGEGARREPNLRASEVELYDGLVAVSQNRWPSLTFDVGEASRLVSPILPAGFYYKTFMWPRAFWLRVYEPLIRRTAGLGKAPAGADPDTYEQIHVDCDVLIAGGGVAGLAAAKAAAAAGARVILADERPRLGGLADIAGGAIDGRAQLDWVREQATGLAQADNVHILTRTTVAGHFHHNYVLMFERAADHDPGLLANGAPRHRLWKVRAKELVLATGAIERPLAFANNDRPGVMLASAARALLERYGVAAGSRAVVVTNNDDAYLTAIALRQAGVDVVRVLDARARVESDLVEQARKAGLDIGFGQLVTNVETTFGGRNIRAVKVAPYRSGANRIAAEERLECDLVCASGGWNPAVHLWCHTAGQLAFDARLHAFRPDRNPGRMRAAGAANATFALPDILREGFAAGEAAAKAALGGRAEAAAIEPPDARQPAEAALEPVWFVPATGSLNEGHKHFLDFQNDVTVADLELAQREGYGSIEHTKRYTTLGMATDQGKTSNINALGALAVSSGRTIPEIGTTTFRPPYTPVSFGAIAGTRTGKRFLPVRRTAPFDWHLDHGASFEPVGLWRRPYCYRQPGEDRHAAVAREIRTVREKVGLLDASTLGKIEVKGGDAAAFLDRVYTNVMSSLKEGRCRYGLMVNETGFLFDDGVVVRLGADRFLCHTTSGGAERVHAWLEEWLQCEWPQYRVFVTNVTEQWAQFAVAGPKARSVLEKLGGDIDLAAEAFPFLSMKTGTLGGYPVRAYRISFSGELSFEIATPANFGRGLWDALLKTGAEYGLEPYGTEALHVLRAEKGFIAIGDETDGTVHPLDLGLDWAVSKKKPDFLGKRSLGLPHLAGAGRKQLVGLLTEDPNEVLPDGAYAVREVKDRPPMAMIGQVTSSYFSPTLQRSIAMALIENGRARLGETLAFPLDGGKVVRARIVEPVFFDKEGARQNV